MSARERGSAWYQASDAKLLAAPAGDGEAFAVFYDRHARAVLNFFLRRTASPDVAGELAAETFAKALVSRRKFRGSAESARPWLMGIAQHEFKKWLRRGRIAMAARQRIGLPRIEMDEESFERIEALVDFAPLRSQLLDGLSHLSPRLREALILRVAMDLPYPEVAERLGCSEGAARVRVARGLARLADALEGTQ